MTEEESHGVSVIEDGELMIEEEQPRIITPPPLPLPVKRCKRSLESPPPKSPEQKQRRSRSHSPPSRPRNFITYSVRPASRSSDCLVILLVPHRQDRRYGDACKKYNFILYDHLYPFRRSAACVLRTNDAYKYGSRYANEDHEKLAYDYAIDTSHRFGEKFVYDYFMDWFDRQNAWQRNRVVFCGLHCQPPGYMLAIRQLRNAGAIVVCDRTKPLLTDANAFVSCGEAFESLLKDISQGKFRI